MLFPATITAIVLQRILVFLAPLFLDKETNDTHEAWQAARETLASYGARTNRELRLAALTIAFGFGALDALCRANDPALALNQVIRLRGNANALNRAANQNENKLEKLQKQQPAETNPADQPQTADDDALPATSETPDLITFARIRPATASQAPETISTATQAVPTPPKPAIPTATVYLSRQQRREAERKAEKSRLRQLAEAKRAQRSTARFDAVYAAAQQAT